MIGAVVTRGFQAGRRTLVTAGYRPYARSLIRAASIARLLRATPATLAYIDRLLTARRKRQANRPPTAGSRYPVVYQASDLAVHVVLRQVPPCGASRKRLPGVDISAVPDLAVRALLPPFVE